jgi:Kef-type K+ transport system membrane component KefB
MFLFAWVAEKLYIAAITGAYFAGVFIGRLKDKHKIEEGVRNIGHTLFVSVFFVFIGIKTDLRELHNFDIIILIFTICYVLLSILSKIIGSGSVAKLIGFDWKRSFRIGSGMVPRGEVALIIAAFALEKNVLDEKYFTAVVAMVIVTATITPFLLKLGFLEKKV